MVLIKNISDSLTKQDDNFWVTFEASVIFEADWLKPTTKPPLPSLTKLSLFKYLTHSVFLGTDVNIEYGNIELQKR